MASTSSFDQDRRPLNIGLLSEAINSLILLPVRLISIHFV
jgi:hypothetical protein